MKRRRRDRPRRFGRSVRQTKKTLVNEPSRISGCTLPAAPGSALFYPVFTATPGVRHSSIRHGKPSTGQIFNFSFYPAMPTKARPIKSGTVGILHACRPRVAGDPPASSPQHSQRVPAAAKKNRSPNNCCNRAQLAKPVQWEAPRRWTPNRSRAATVASNCR